MSYSPDTLNSGKHWWVFDPRDLEIWQMTSTNNRALLLWYFKLCASLRSHLWIRTGVTVRKLPNWNFFYLCYLDLCLWTLTFCKAITSLNRYYSSKHVLMIRLQEHYEKRCNRGTDRRTDVRMGRKVLSAVGSQLKNTLQHCRILCYISMGVAFAFLAHWRNNSLALRYVFITELYDTWTYFARLP